VWRNVLKSSRKGPKSDEDSNRGAYLIKLGGDNQTFTKGKIYIFHNTMLQPPPRNGFKDTSGGNIGISVAGADQKESNVTSRNNILYGRDETFPIIRDRSKDASNDFDYDLYSGILEAYEGCEPHGIKGIPQFDKSKQDVYPLQGGSPGFDAGIRLPNFNDDFTGKAPDLGAFEGVAP